MASEEKPDSDLKRQLIQEVSRVQTSNLRRVESTSGMKTIFSSDDYYNTHGQPKPKFRIHGVHHGHKGRGVHKTPQSPGRNRVKAIHNEHKVISADLFENRDVKTSNSKPIQYENEQIAQSSFIPPDDPLATSTLKPEVSGSRLASEKAKTENGENDVNANIVLTPTSTNTGQIETSTTDFESVVNGETLENKSSLASVEVVNVSSIEKDSGHASSSMDQSREHNKQTITSERAEIEMTLPNDRIEHSAGMSVTESTISDEDHTIRDLLDLAQNQETELKETESKNVSLRESLLPDLNSPEFSSQDNSNNVDSISSDKTRDSLRIRRNKTDRKELPDSVKLEQRNSDGLTSVFDVKDIISSTPQAGSPYDGNSEIGSVHSGKGGTSDRDGSTINSNRTSTQSDMGQDQEILSEISANVNACLQTPQTVDKGVLADHDSDISPDNSALGKDITEPNKAWKHRDTEGNVGYNQDDPSQVEIEETHRQFDQILADLSTSMEDDFTMSEKTVGRQLSSEADVIVHSTDDDISDTETKLRSQEAYTVQEFTDLESSVISLPNDATVTTSFTQPDSNSHTTSGKDMSMLQLSRLASTSGQNIAEQPGSPMPSNDSDQVENVEITGITHETQLTTQKTEGSNGAVGEHELSQNNGTPRSNSQEDTSQEFLNLETSHLHVDRNDYSEKEESVSATHSTDRLSLADVSQSNENNVEQSFSELTPTFHTSMDANKLQMSNKPVEKSDNKITLMYSDVETEPPREDIINQDTGVYSEAYQTSTNVDTPRDSVSENSPVYESISDDLNTSVGQEKLSYSVISETNNNVSGRLSPLGAEGNSNENKTSWNRESYSVGGGTTILRVSSMERKEPVRVAKKPDSSYLSKPRPFGVKKKSEFQMLSENVNVKGLAKQLEKSLDFSKLVRPANENTDETDRENAPRSPKKVKSQDPKDAFGSVLSEIFQKTRARSTDDDEKQMDGNIPSYENFGLRKTALESLLKKKLEKENTQILANASVEAPTESSQQYISAEQASVQQAEYDSRTETESPRQYFKEKKSLSASVSDKTEDTFKPVQFQAEDNSQLHRSSRGDTYQPRFSRNDVSANMSSNEVSMPEAVSDTQSSQGSVKSDRSSNSLTLREGINNTASINEYANEDISSAELVIPDHGVTDNTAPGLYGKDLKYTFESDRREFDNISSQSDETEEQITYQTEEVLLYDNNFNEPDGVLMNKNSDNTGYIRRESERFYSDRSDGSGHGKYKSDHPYLSTDSHNSELEREAIEVNGRQTSMINNNTEEQTVKYQSQNIYKPRRFWDYNTPEPTISKEPASSFIQHSVTDSDQDESLGSVTTLQDNDNLSDVSGLDDTLSRSGAIAGSENKRLSADFTSQRDISRNNSFSEDTYTSVHEEFYVPVPRQQLEEWDHSEANKHLEQIDSFPSYRERFFEKALVSEEPVVLYSQRSNETFLHEPSVPKENVNDSSNSFFERYPTVNSADRPGQASRESSLTRLDSADTSTGDGNSQWSQPDTVQGRSAWSAYTAPQIDNSVFSAPSGYSEKPAEQLRENNINIAKKGDGWDHVTFSSSNHPLSGVETSSDSDVTTPLDIGEEFNKRGEKLSENAFPTNLTSESRPREYEKSLSGSNHSLFYDDSSEARQVNSVSGVYNTYDRDSRQRGNKYQRGSMAYLLTSKDHVSTSNSRSGRSTPQGKLYASEDILVSPTADDERRGSHSSRDYLSDNHGGQDFFHFDRISPSNGDRNGSESRGERIQHIEKSERHSGGSTTDHFQPLPDTYIGSNKSAELVVPVQFQTNSNGQRPDTVSNDSSNVSVHEIKPSSSNHGKHDNTGGKRRQGKKSEHIRTEHVTTTTHSSPHSHNGTDRNGHHKQTNVIHIKTNSTGPESGLRERRDGDLTDLRVVRKPPGDDDISISSLSSQSSSSFAEAGHSFDSPTSRNHQQKEKQRILRTEESRRVPISVQYLPETRIHGNQGSMPKHAKKMHDNRAYRNSNTDLESSGRDSRSTKDVQYLINSMESEMKHPRRPIPGVDRDAFSYHVTSASNENKSSSRNNHVNEVDVTTREAMRDRSKKGAGSSHVIKQFKEERIVEDVKGSPSSIHISPETSGSNRTIVLQNGQAPNRAITIHPPSVGRSDSDRTVTYEENKRGKRKEKVSSGETKLYVDSSSMPNYKVKSEKVRAVNRDKTYRKGHSVDSDDNSSEDESGKHRHPESGKVSTVVYDFRSKPHPSLSNVVHLEGAKGLKTKDSVNSHDIYSTPRNTDKPFRNRSSSESSLSDHEHRKGTLINKAKSEELWLTQDLNRQQPRKYKSENVFYEHYNVKRDNPMYVEGDKVVYVSPQTRHGAHGPHGARSPTREIYVDTKSHPTTRHQLSSSFSSISPTGSPTPEDRHVTTVSFDESFNRKRSGSPMGENHIYQPKVHVKKHRVVKTDEQIIRPAESDNELYVRGSRSSPYRVVVKGDRHRSGRSSDTDESFYSDSRTTGSHRSTINISRGGSDRRPDPSVPAVMSIPLSNQPVAMTIPGVQETKYVTNKSERMELRRSASLDSIRDMVDYPNRERVLRVGSSSDIPSSPEMRSPSSPYVSTITILNRKLNVKDPNIDSGTGTEVISSDDDIRYRSQLNPVKEEVVYATKEAPRETRRSEKHTTYTTYEEYRDRDNYEYVKPNQEKVTTVRQERHIPIREERIRPIHQDRAKEVRESLHEKFGNMSYEQSREPQQVEQKSTSDLKVVRGQFVIRNSMDIDLDEGDSLGVDDNINIFDNSFTMNKENPLYQSDPDLYKKFESETIEERRIRIKPDPPHGRSDTGGRDYVDEVDARGKGQKHVGSGSDNRLISSEHLAYDRNDLDVPYAEGDFGDGAEDIIQNTRQAAVKSAPNKKKQNLSQMLLSKLAQIDSKDITQHIDVQHHNEEIYGDIKFIHADGSKAEAMDTTNFDSVSEHIDLMLKEGKALITIKVTAERIIPIDFEFNVWRKSQAIVTRNIEIDLKANDQRRRLYEHVMETTPSKMIGSSSMGYQDTNEAVLSSKDTLKLFSRLLSVAEKDDKAIERDEVRYETKHRDRSDSLPSLNNVDMLY